jgi:hypothetical protein
MKRRLYLRQIMAINCQQLGGASHDGWASRCRIAKSKLALRVKLQAPAVQVREANYVKEDGPLLRA